MTKVLIADALSPSALDIFRERGIEAVSRTGLPQAELKEIIGGYYRQIGVTWNGGRTLAAETAR